MPANRPKQQGFTLLELLIVVSVIAIIAGMSLMSYSNTRSDSEDRAVRVEMQQLQQAVIRYFSDQNTYDNGTTASSPSDISFLIDMTPSWDPDYRKGWRGPYLKRSVTTSSDIMTDSLNFNGGARSVAKISVPVKNDPYYHPYSPPLPTGEKGYYHPYLFFDLDKTLGNVPRIVSVGADGNYESPDCDFSVTDTTDSDYCSYDKLCEEQGDDWVVCL
jgi:prepilin-type N-terminal cleavage/methylation domain-containing protein